MWWKFKISKPYSLFGTQGWILPAKKDVLVKE